MTRKDRETKLAHSLRSEPHSGDDLTGFQADRFGPGNAEYCNREQVRERMVRRGFYESSQSRAFGIKRRKGLNGMQQRQLLVGNGENPRVSELRNVPHCGDL
jgi:hypothetical protein